MRSFSRLTSRSAVGTALLVLAALALQSPSSAATAGAPFEVLPADPLANFTEFNGLPTTATERVPVSGNPNFTEALQITVPNGPQSPGLDGEYSITLGIPAAATVTSGDALLATFWARSVEPIAGGTTGNAHAVFETDGSPYKKSMNVALQYGSEWQKCNTSVTIPMASGTVSASGWTRLAANNVRTTPRTTATPRTSATRTRTTSTSRCRLAVTTSSVLGRPIVARPSSSFPTSDRSA